MFKTFTNIEELLKEVHADRNVEGDGAGTANRFPVRFVLFDNFRDCCNFVEVILHLPHVAIQRIEDWMDDEYPDVFLPHDKLAKKILSLIRTTPAEYRIIMPFRKWLDFIIIMTDLNLIRLFQQSKALTPLRKDTKTNNVFIFR